MKKLTEEIKEELRVPFGEAYTSALELLNNYPNKKIVAVGDQTVLEFLRVNIVPYVSVFDFKTLRKRIPKKDEGSLKKMFPNPTTLRNLPSTVSKRLLIIAPMFLKSGGALRVFGEEDLVALIFMYFAEKGTIVVYGQKGLGMIVFDPEKGRTRVERILDQILPDFYP